MEPYAGSDAVAILDELVRRAANLGASDIHLEPKRDRMQVRFRIDGTMVEQPAIEMEIVFRVQRLVAQPHPSLVQPAMPSTSPLIGNERLERAGLTVEIGHFDGLDNNPEYAIEVTYEGLYELAEETLADGASTLLDDHFGALGGWIAATLVKLGDLKLAFLPADPVE